MVWVWIISTSRGSVGVPGSTGLGDSSSMTTSSLREKDETLDWVNVWVRGLSFSRMEEKEERETRSGVDGRPRSSSMFL